METQFKTNGKIFNPFKKLVIGIILFASFFVLNNYVGGADGLTDIENFSSKSILSVLPSDLASIIASIVSIIIAVAMLYMFISGLYRICTFNIYNPVFEDYTPGGIPVKGCDSYPEINRVLSYRESKMAGMSSERAAELYISSSKIESLYTGYSNGPETQRTLSFIESKLSGMSPDRGLNYLANKL
jgi:hypothetical protein